MGVGERYAARVDGGSGSLAGCGRWKVAACIVVDNCPSPFLGSMAPKARSKGAPRPPRGKRVASAISASDPLDKASPSKKPREYVDKRSLHERARRAIQDSMPSLPKSILETKRVDGVLLSDRVVTALDTKNHGERLSKTFWQSMQRLYGCEQVGLFEYIPRNGEKVTDQMMNALDSATSTDNKERNIDPLIHQLQFGPSLGEKDAVR